MPGLLITMVLLLTRTRGQRAIDSAGLQPVAYRLRAAQLLSSRHWITINLMLKKTIKLLYLSAGLICTALGIIGAFVPVLPTTPFLLVALWAFSKSSPRLRNWLYNHARYGKTLREWFDHGVISTRVKIIAIAAMAVSIPTLYLLTESLLMVSIHAPVIILTAVFILSRPSTYVEPQSTGTNQMP